MSHKDIIPCSIGLGKDWNARRQTLKSMLEVCDHTEIPSCLLVGHLFV